MKRKQIDGIYINLGDLKEAIKKAGHRKYITLSEGSTVIKVDVDKIEEIKLNKYQVCPFCGHVIDSYEDDGDGCSVCRPETKDKEDVFI